MLSAERTTRPHPFLYPSRRIKSTLDVSVQAMQSDNDHIEHIWIITGPAGCGKTTVAQHLASELSLPYVEGDDVRFMHGTALLAPLMQAHSSILPPTSRKWPRAFHSQTPTAGTG